jgi:predicted NAD/FAD-binding protein
MKIAVVGSGVSGLAATWVTSCSLPTTVAFINVDCDLPQLLNEHSDHQVHLYETDDRPGGHANTVRFIPPGKEAKDGVDVDT